MVGKRGRLCWRLWDRNGSILRRGISPESRARHLDGSLPWDLEFAIASSVRSAALAIWLVSVPTATDRTWCRLPRGTGKNGSCIAHVVCRLIPVDGTGTSWSYMSSTTRRIIGAMADQRTFCASAWVRDA